MDRIFRANSAFISSFFIRQRQFVPSVEAGADYKTKSGTKRCEFYNEGFRRNNNIAPEFVDIMPKYRGQINRKMCIRDSLDIGCGSGALTNRCARAFPLARAVGIDFWGKEWSYAKEQCEQNAAIEGVQNRVSFQKGDAAHLDFPDEFFDAVVSNFVFHEVRSEKDKRNVVQEALRVLKKGGSFSLQDLFSQEKLYGNMEEFAEELRREGFQEVHYIPFIEREHWIPRYIQAPWMLYGVGLLYGKK